MKRRRGLIFGLAVVPLAAIAIGVLFVAHDIAGRSGFGCIRPNASYDLGGGDGSIASLVVSSSNKSRIYVSTGNGRLYVGSGTRDFRWRARAVRAPGWLAATVGKHRDILFSAAGGVYRSNNGGRSWKPLTCDLIVTDIAVAPTDPQTIYVATDLGVTSDDPEWGGLDRSTDGGKSWSHFTPYVDLGYSDDVYSELQTVDVDPISPGTVYVTSAVGGIFRSGDGGEHWTFNRIKYVKAQYGPAQVSGVSFGPGNQHDLWAGTDAGIFRSNESGLRWSRVGSRARPSGLIVPDGRLPNVFFLPRASSFGPEFPYGGEGRAMRTTDGGRHWLRINALPRSIVGLAVQPIDDSVFAWTDETVFRSRDHGVTWTRLPRLPS
jgi:photosystem II stability/assembly factor-like uncharacterized protein